MTVEPLPDTLAAAGVARRRLADVLTGWPADARDAALLLTSELVSNAVLHGAAPVSLSIQVLSRSGLLRLRVEVHDGNPDLPATPSQDRSDSSEHGRGLQIVRALASDWGSRAADGTPGKTSWFELDAV